MTERIELHAEDYEYQLPDHWVDHTLRPDSTFTKLHTYYVNRVADLIVQYGAKTVLEVGCGDGWNCAKFVERGLEVVGTDWSRKGVTYAEMNVPDAQFYCGDLRDREFLERFPNQFDALALVEVIEHIPPDHTVEAVRNITSRLKSGGLFVLTTPHVNYPNTSHLHWRHFTPEMLTDILAEVGGFEFLSVEGYGDVKKDQAYWRKMRWLDNRYYTLKPLVRRLNATLDYTSPTPMDCAHGIIMTWRKT